MGEDKGIRGGQVFVTVGTTLFDSLVKEASSPQCREVLVDLGYTSLVIQRGKGTFKPVEVNTASPIQWLSTDISSSYAISCFLGGCLIWCNRHRG